jgi:hypothetical protein
MRFFRRLRRSLRVLHRCNGGRLRLERLEERTLPSVVVGVSVEGMNTTNNEL